MSAPSAEQTVRGLQQAAVQLTATLFAVRMAVRQSLAGFGLLFDVAFEKGRSTKPRFPASGFSIEMQAFEHAKVKLK